MPGGLENLLADAAMLDRLRNRRVGLCCNHTAIDRRFDHALDLLAAAGVRIRRLFGPEHGVDATAQDMVGVQDESRQGIEVVSLYGDTEASLHPAPETLADLDVVLFDIQDIGARYYTYQATLGYLMQAAAGTGCTIIVLDRPNPIDGVTVEGNVVQPGYESFVSAFPLAIRHGMTMGELARFFQRFCGMADTRVEVVPCTGWRRDQWLDETDLPWVLPSPNMPTLDTAAIYPGMCLLEGTDVSEGRGTTRPFHLFGAPWVDRRRLLRLLRLGAEDAGLEGVGFRAATFEPRFQKHAGTLCHGAEVMITERVAIDSVLLGLVVLEAFLRLDPDREHFAWRTEPYEFVANPIAIDLLGGSSELRLALEAKVSPRELIAAWTAQRREFEERREACLLY
ncbi:MAG: DUF1343 domain-containing protein [Deltaproteobacteria bacterium]|nr:MAG: DUF1343 domain-containing protein [Deltaproteobacteria bacterium]